MRERESYREIIWEDIDYDILTQDEKLDRDRLDELVELMVDTVCSNREMIRIAGDDYPAEVVKSRFLKIDSSHIEYVLTGCGRTSPMSATSRNICWRRCITRRSRWTATTHFSSTMTCTAAEIGACK